MRKMYLVTDLGLGGFQVKVNATSYEDAIRRYHEIYGNLNNVVFALPLN